ncbi:MAG: RNA pseudouridine synthase [Bdellovibrionales bacterium]|nr:RNA pseudouridine synthase [Bdellovibrionales bacterium]
MSPLSTQNGAWASSQVLFEDNHVLVVFKPAGWLTQGDQSGAPSLMDWAKTYLKEKYHKPGNVFLGLVHRLDKQVPGIVLFAKTSKGASRLSEQFRSRQIEKKYLALVEGRIPKSGTLVHYLGDNASRGVHVQDTDGPGLKRAELHYMAIERGPRQSLIEIKLITGRKHQIRAQLARSGHPIVGDAKYGAASTEGDTIALLAHSLRFKKATQDEEQIVALLEPGHFFGEFRQ